MSGRQRLWEQAVIPVSPHPGRAHLPPSSHTSATVFPCTRPAPWGAWGAHGASCLMEGQGLHLAGSPGTEGSFAAPVLGGEAAQVCSLAVGRRSAPLAEGT